MRGRSYLLSLAAAFAMAAAVGTVVYVLGRSSAPNPDLVRTANSALGAKYHLILEREVAVYADRWHVEAGGSIGYLGAGTSAAADVRLNSGAALAFAVLASDRAALARQEHATGPPRTARSQVLAAGAAMARPLGSNVHYSPLSGRAAGVYQPSLSRAVMLVRFLALSHRIGASAATDGKKWGASDWSPVDAANLGLAAYLIRADLDTPTFRTVSDLVRFEAERYLLASPATGASGDSAAVPNAAASAILCEAGTLYSTGQSRSVYEHRAADFLKRVLTTNYDASAGKAVTPTLFPDLTVQYDGVFSPSAELQVLATLGRCALCYRLAGQPAPPELTQHVTDCWRRVLVRLSLTGGWFLAGDAGVTSGGAAISWLASDFADPAARTIDADAADRLLHTPSLMGEIAATPLAESRVCDAAYQELSYSYLSQSEPPALALTDGALWHSLSGVTWLRAAAIAIHRTDRTLVSYSWTAGAGKEWSLDGDQHLQWRFAPTADANLPPSTETEAPAWTEAPDGFGTLGTLRLENGAIQAGVYSLPGGLVVLVEHAVGSGEMAALSLLKNSSVLEPDLFRDDEAGSPHPESARWANVDNRLGIVVLDGTVTSMAPPGVSASDIHRNLWPLVTVGPGSDRNMVVVLYPDWNWQRTREAARDAEILNFAGEGWVGALLPGPGGPANENETLVLGRFAGGTSTMASLSSPWGAPVTVEDSIVAGRFSTLEVSSPEGSARWETISCWLDAGRGSINARQGSEARSASITNPGQETASIHARYVSDGRPCVVTEEDGREIVRLAPRRGLGEVHFYLAPGRIVTLRY